MVWFRMVAVALAAVTLTGCGLEMFAAGPVDTDRPVGPEYRFGPVPVLDADDEATGQEAGVAVWYRIRDGHCLEFAQGTSCVGGEHLPMGFTGFGAVQGEGRTCLDAVTEPMVEVVDVTRPGHEAVRLDPLPGPDDAPVRVFAICWSADVDPDTVTAQGFGADGESMGPGGR